MNKKQKDKMINLILILVAIMLVIINIIIILKVTNNDSKVKSAENNTSQEDNDEEDEEIDESKDIKEMDESERMMYYINTFLDSLEEKDYKKAYNYLNDEFKDNYFRTEDEFKNYIENNYNISTITMNFNNIERLGNPVTGNIYVVFVNLVDFQKNINKETSFVILEKNYNEFELSFSLN